MKKQINQIHTKAKRHKTLIQNFSYLSSLQIFNLIIPLLTYPYLIRTLGSEKFGLVFFAQAVIGYLVIFVSFGFNLSATKEISINRENNKKLNEIFSSVIIIKGILFLLSFAFLALILYFLEESEGNKLLFYFTMWRCLYEFLFPLWFFQGIEKMKYITIITLISRIIFLTLIFIFIREPEHYILVPVMYGIGAIASGVISIIIVYNHNVKISLQPWNKLKYYFKDSFPLFISNLSTSIAINTNKVILGIFAGMQEVAYYELAEKLSLIMKTPIQLIGQAIYPGVAQKKDQIFLKKSFAGSILLASIIFVFGMIFSDLLIKLFGGENMEGASYIFQILLGSIFPVTVSLFFANIVLISWGYNKDFLKLRISTNILYAFIVLVLFLINSINLETLAFTILVVEIFAAIASVFFTNRKRINFLKPEIL